MKNLTPGYRNRWIGLLFLGISLLVISLDNTILNVALPSISKQLGASASELQWIVDAYVLVFASLLLTMGSVSDRIGRKKALQAGLVLFSLGSLAAALSTSTEMLIASRAFLGIGGATIMPSTLSLITATFRDPQERSQAIAIWAAVFGLGIGLGPVVGGWLLEHFDWNAVFFVNLPIVVVGLIGDHFFLDESWDTNAPRPDVPGVLLSITGLFALVYGIIEAGQEGWTAGHALAAFGAAALLLGIFARWESRAPNAMLPLRFFSNMSFTGANLSLTLITFGMFGSMFFMSQYFQSVQGYSALQAGLRILPMALVIMVAATSSARVSARLGIKRTVGIGILLAGSGLFFLSQMVGVDTAYPIVLLGLVITGMGLGTAMPPATDSIMGAVPVDKAGVGSAMNDTTRQLGGALGVAVLGTIMNSVYLSRVDALQSDLAQLAAGLKDNPLLGQFAQSFGGEIPTELPPQALEAVRSSIQGAHIIAGRIPIPPVADLIRDTANQAFVAGMSEALIVGAAVLVVAALISFAILPARIRRFQEDEPQVGAPEMAAAATGVAD